ERLLRYLHDAAWIAGGHDARSRLADALDLSAPELGGHLGLEEIVDARAPAAEIAVLEVHQGQPRDAPQELSGLGAHLLPVSEMTGVMVGHRLSQLAQRQVRVDERLGDVLHE